MFSMPFPQAEKHQLTAEILRRCSPDEGLPEAALDELAAERFRSYDVEEDAELFLRH
jgi:hypothetical protein